MTVSTDRRDFLKTAGAAGVTATAAASVAGEASAANPHEADAYAKYLESDFKFSLDNGNWFHAKLTEVEVAGTAPKAGHRQSFSLVFTAPAEMEVQQDTYTIDHPRLGRKQLLITPVDGLARETRLQAVFG